MINKPTHKYDIRMLHVYVANNSCKIHDAKADITDRINRFTDRMGNSSAPLTRIGKTTKKKIIKGVILTFIDHSI